MRDLDQSEIDSIFSNRCPACGSTTEGFYRGAEGGLALNIYCANIDECGAGYNLLGASPEINIGGQLVKPSKLGDVRAPEPEVSLPPWWPESPPIAFDLVLAVAVLIVFVGVAALLLWLT